jgi:hypothetical protein
MLMLVKQNSFTHLRVLVVAVPFKPFKTKRTNPKKKTTKPQKPPKTQNKPQLKKNNPTTNFIENKPQTLNPKLLTLNLSPYQQLKMLCRALRSLVKWKGVGSFQTANHPTNS